MQYLSRYQQLLQDKLPQLKFPERPSELYEPASYMMALGGKRIRPLLVLMSCDMFGGDVQKALDPALAMEVFHNFTLIHDDLMDHAPVRRGKPTVHTRWNDSTAILSGDVMLVLAYDLLTGLEADTFKEAVLLFNQTAKKVCEGQQFDMLFERREQVSIDDYIEMIGLKTAALLAGCLKMGALLAKAPGESAELVYEFGYAIGTAFQIQDDLLDTYGEAENFGKKIGGDIAANKKTYLTLYSFEKAGKEELDELTKLFDKNVLVPEDEKINRVMALYEKTGARKATEEARDAYYNKAMSALDRIQGADEEVKENMRRLANELISRAK